MAGYSAIEARMERAQRELEQQKALRPTTAWPEAERTPERRDKRVAAALEDFWSFDRTYFTPEMYQGGYAQPCEMHQEIVFYGQEPGVHVILGPRDAGKTVTGKKQLAWLLVTGKIHGSATYSHTVPTSQRILDDVSRIIKENPRILEDFGVEIVEDNAEQFRFTTRIDRELRTCAAFSEGKSVRGFTIMFGRPEFVLADDIETAASSLGDEHSEARIDAVGEAYLSLIKTGVLIWFANNFDVGCATNKLRKRYAGGLLADHWHVHVYRAWENGQSFWPQRFPAKSEAEMKRMMRAKDERDWRGNFQQDPIEEDGLIFPREWYREYKKIPEDARGTGWCDPNLSLKSKGDTTAIGAMLYSGTTNRFYVRDVKCKSYSDSNDLLDDYITVKKPDINCLGFDGNVNQESNWTNHVRNWCKNNKAPFPRLEYRRYNVDFLAKNAQLAWCEGRILFPPGFIDTPEGQAFLSQVFPFAGKKAGKPDDGADWLISNFELIHERGLAKPRSEDNSPKVHIISGNGRTMF